MNATATTMPASEALANARDITKRIDQLSYRLGLEVDDAQEAFECRRLDGRHDFGCRDAK
jgi:hypothetical protein